MAKPRMKKLIEGSVYHNVMLMTCFDEGITRPRVRAVSDFTPETRVEFPRTIRSKYPVGTQFRATVKVCQKHWLHNGLPKGAPYLLATEIEIQRTMLRRGSNSGRAYDRVWKKLT
jgi:hypothetical protein